jgi:D-alanine-D-alanine ligase-like ATP-grasp enzyme
MGKERLTRQFFGHSRYYPGPCVELAFPAVPHPVSVTALEKALRQRLPRWEESLPDKLPAEEAIARLAQTFVANKITTWCRFRREGDIAVSAVGMAVSSSFVAALLSALERALLGQEHARTEAFEQIDRLVKTLLREMAINWTAMDMGRRLGLETAWISQRMQLYQIGIGARGRHFRQFSSERDSLTGSTVAGSKHHTIEVLRKLNLPTTRGVVIANAAAATAAIRRIGFPCVVKPLSMGQGKGITTGIVSQSQLETAIGRAIAVGSAPVLVENHVEGIDHRIMVVGGQVLWAYSKVPASVAGDGVSSVQALIHRENDGRNAAKEGGHTLSQPIRINEELVSFLLRRYGVRLSDVLPTDQRIELAGQSNISMGGTLTDVTSDLHPDNRLLAMRVARYLRMDALGIDFVTPDISRSWKEVDCAIIEVNTLPGISGPGDAALSIRTQFPRLRSGRIPVFAAVGGSEFRAVATKWLLSAIARTGVRAKEIEYKTDRRMPAIIAARRPPAIEAVVLDPDLEALVLSCQPEWIEQRGFPLVHADLVLAEDPASVVFLDEIADEIASLPRDASDVAKRVAEIVAGYTDEGSIRPVVKLRTDQSAGLFHLECLRFGATPRDWFYRGLDLPTDNDKGMIGFADVFHAIERLSHSALLERGIPGLTETISFEAAGPGWAIPSVEGTLTMASETMDSIEQALAHAIRAINGLLARGPD